jgi:hypothetical protein
MKKTALQLRISTILALLCCISNFTMAQQNGTPTDTSRFKLYRTSPVWKDMLDDPNANYFEVQKAFELFWSGKELPVEEDEIIGEDHRLKNNFINRTFNAKELREQQERDALAFDYKRYHWWLIKMEPYVQEDGRILTMEQRLELWKKHYEELNKQDGK